MALEIKGGQTFTKDYMKNLQNFAKKESGVKIKKAIVFAGEQSATIKDVQLLPWSKLSAIIDELI